jgi:iron(III) transport system permease protein
VTSPPRSFRQIRTVFNARVIIAVFVGVVVLALVVPPLLYIFLTSLHVPSIAPRGFFAPLTFMNFTGIFEQSDAVKLVINTLVFAALSASLSLLVAGAIAWFSERTDAPVRRIAYVAAFASFAIPALVIVFGWSLLLNPNNGIISVAVGHIFGRPTMNLHLDSMVGMVCLQSLVLFPLNFLLLSPAFAQADAAMEDAAYVGGAGALRTAFKVTVPLARPALLTAWLLTFLISLESYEVPAITGVPAHINVLSTQIVLTLQSGIPNNGEASAYGVLLLTLTAIVLFFYQRALRNTNRFVSVLGRSYSRRRFKLGAWRWLVTGLVSLFSLLVALPVLILAWTSFLPYPMVPSHHAFSILSTASYSAIFSSSTLVDDAIRTFEIALIATTVLVAFTFVASYVFVRGRGSRLIRIVELVASAPLILPALVLSLGLLDAYVSTPIYDTGLILVLAFVTHYIPYGLRFGSTSVMQLSPELEESAQVGGASLARTLRLIVWPLAREPMIVAGCFVFISIVKMLALVLLITGPNSSVITADLFNAWETGLFSEAAALAMLLLVAMGVMAAIVYGGFRLARSRKASTRSVSSNAAYPLGL